MTTSDCAINGTCGCSFFPGTVFAPDESDYSAYCGDNQMIINQVGIA